MIKRHENDTLFTLLWYGGFATEGVVGAGQIFGDWKTCQNVVYWKAVNIYFFFLPYTFVSQACVCCVRSK